LRLLERAAATFAFAISVTVAAAWISFSINRQSSQPIESVTAPGTVDVFGQGRVSSSSGDAVDVTFEARWARATLSVASSTDPTLTRAADIDFESRWTLASDHAVPMVVSDDLANGIVFSPVLMHFVQLTFPAAPASANPVPLPSKRVSKRAQGVSMRRPKYEIARASANERVPRVLATAALPPPASTSDKKRAPSPTGNNRTAVYDISARRVYLPNGEALEAHSGLGDKMDDPRYVNVKMRGPTPPNIYDLTLREKPFHGVRAIRLNPVDDEKMFGRAGMLAHTYMLGSNGQSNGCVSFRDYRKFLQAFLAGQIDRLVVVPNLAAEPLRTVRTRDGRILQYAFNNQ